MGYELGGYDKKKCFANYPTLVDRDSPTQLYKNWFDEQEQFWGRGNSNSTITGKSSVLMSISIFKFFHRDL